MLLGASNIIETADSEFNGYLFPGIVQEIEDNCPEWPSSHSEWTMGSGDELFSYSLAELVALMESSIYVGSEGVLQAVSDGVLAFAAFQQKPHDADRQTLAKLKLEAKKVPVPGKKTCKIWMIRRLGDTSIDEIRAADLCWPSIRSTALGPYQTHMSRFRLEMAQSAGNVGMSLLRTFIDSFLFELVRVHHPTDS